MKKIIILILLIVICLTGCDGVGYNETEYNTSNNDNRLKIIYKDANRTIVVDNKTGVQYLRCYQGGIVVMVDENGNPLIYEEAKNEE